MPQHERELRERERRSRFASICSARRVKGLMSQPITVHNRRIKVQRGETSPASLGDTSSPLVPLHLDRSRRDIVDRTRVSVPHFTRA